MSDTATTDAPEAQPDDTPDTGTTPDLTAEVEKWKAQARKHEDRAKANAAAAKELEQVKQASMSEIEKAVTQAKAEGRAEGIREGATKVAVAELRAAASGRLEVTDDFVAGVNFAAFIDDDGEVDRSKVTAFVDGIAPKQEQPAGFPDLGQGTRTTPALPLNGDPLQRALESKLGIR